MKKLICVKDVEEFCKTGSKVFNIEKNTIITPAAIDLAKNNGIEFVKSECCSSNTSSCCASSSKGIDSDLIYNALQSMASAGKLNEFLTQFAKQTQPYLCEKDSNGFKLVRGNTVNLEELDTGNPQDKGKVHYQELISSSDNSPMNAGFLNIERCKFDWDVTVDEIYYIIEGTLTITIDNKVYTAHPGDSLYAPKGSKVKWGSPDKVKVFYATY